MDTSFFINDFLFGVFTINLLLFVSVCANITYAPQKKNQLFLEVFFNEKPASRYGLSARNPSPLCIPIMMNIPMAMCVQMSNIAVQGNNLNMCMDFVVRLASADLFEMHFQCMRMGLDGVQYVDKDGKPVIPMSGATKADNDNNDDDEYYDDTAVNILPIQPDDGDNEIDTNDSATDTDSDSDNDNDGDSESESDNEIIAEPAIDSEMILVSKETNEVPKPITSSIILEYTDEPTTTTIDQAEYEEEEDVETETEKEEESETELEENQMSVIDTVTKLVTELSALETTTTTSSLIEVPTAQTTTTTANDYDTKQHAVNVTQDVEPLKVVILSNLQQNELKPTNESLSVVEQVTKVPSTAVNKVQARRLKPHTSSKTHSKNIVPAMNPFSFYKRLLGFL